MHKFLEHYILGTGYDDLTGLGQEAKAMAQKVIDVGLAPVESISALKSRYTTLVYTQVQQTWYVYTTYLETIVDFKQANRPKKEWIEDYYFRSQRTPWHTTMSTGQRSDKELSWFARPTYITKNLDHGP